MAEQYLSTDPNAGVEDQYLSTDPNAGLESQGGIGAGVLSAVGHALNPINLVKGALGLGQPSDISQIMRYGKTLGEIVTGTSPDEAIGRNIPELQHEREAFYGKLGTKEQAAELTGLGLQAALLAAPFIHGKVLPRAPGSLSEVAGIKPVEAAPEAVPQTPEPPISETVQPLTPESVPKVEEVIPNAEQVQGPARPDVNVQLPGGESAREVNGGEMPANVGGEGVPQGGQGETLQQTEKVIPEKLPQDITWEQIHQNAEYVRKGNTDQLVTVSPSTTKDGWSRINYWDQGGIVSHLEIPDERLESVLQKEAYPRGAKIISVEGGIGGTYPSADYAGMGFYADAKAAKGVKTFVGPADSVDWMRSRLESGGYKVSVKDVPEPPKPSPLVPEGGTELPTQVKSEEVAPVPQPEQPPQDWREGFTPKGDYPVSKSSIDKAFADYPTKPEGWSQERYDTFIRQRAGAIEDQVRREASPVSQPTETTTAQPLPKSGAGASTGSGPVPELPVSESDLPPSPLTGKEPPVPEGMTRLYRGESVKGISPSTVPEFLKGQKLNLVQGRWWTQDPREAALINRLAGKGKVLYQDVPTDVVEASRLSNFSPDHPARKYSFQPSKEFFLPEEYIGKGTPIDTGTQPVEPPAAPPQVPAEAAASDNPQVSRIANRYVEERVASGEIGEIAPSQGYSTQELAAAGLKMSPEEITQHISDLVNKTGDPIKQAEAVRAEESRLSQASLQASRLAEANPNDANLQAEADNAFKNLTDFHNGPVAQAKENFHALGMSMQGELPVDLSTFNGLREQWLKDTGKPPTPEQDAIIKKQAAKVATTISEDSTSRANLRDAIDKATAKRKLPTPEEVQNNIMERMKVEPCLT